MKKIASLLLALSLVFCVLLALPLNVSAASSTTQDGLEVTITTDKTEYTADEDIQVSVSVKNNNSYKVEGISVETLLPEGLVLKTGNLSATDIDVEAGASYAASVVARLSEDLKDNEGTISTEPTAPTQPTTPDSDTPKTGDDFNLVLWVVLLVASAVGIVLAVVLKKKMRIICLLLCGAMLLTMVPAEVFATETAVCTISVDTTVEVADVAAQIQAKVSYVSGDVTERPVLALQTSENFLYNSDNEYYTLSGEMSVLSGTLSNSAKVESVKLELSYNQENVAEFNIDPQENWSASNFGLLPGENTLKFYMTDDDGVVWVQSETVMCSTTENIDNIIEDTAANTDTDQLPDYIETLFGTDSEKSDTDGDGLNDDIEGQILGCDARFSDTDGDGVDDATEDADSDGISNLAEVQGGTNPCCMDTDEDGLNDYEELYTYQTIPTNKDTDGDGVEDGWEIENGTDPKTAESSFQVTTSMDAGDSTVEVQLDLPGAQAQTLTVAPAEEEVLNGAIPGQLSMPVSLTVDGALPAEGATLRFAVADTYPASQTADFCPVVYYFNPETQLLEEVTTTYSNHVAEAHLEHFSTYILLNKRDFDEVWETEIRAPGEEGQEHPDRLDVVLVIDSSGSMQTNDRNGLRKEAAKRFVDKLGENDRAAIIDFDSYTTVLSEFTNDKAALYAAIDRVNSSGGTSLTRGISPAIDMFTNANYSNEAYRYIIMLTDGDGSYDTNLTAKAKNNKIQIYTIGLGSGVVVSRLQAIADGTDGKYYFASTADELEQIYDDTAMETIDYSTDSNGDGISDYYTRLIADGTMRDGAGKRYFVGAITSAVLDEFPNELSIENLIYNTIQKNADYDGDGLKNGQELVITEKNGKVYVKMISDPSLPNSDSDIFDDRVEYTLGGHPFAQDVEAFYLDDMVNSDYFVAAMCADEYIDNGWYRVQLGLGNFIYGGEYDWNYAAQKQLLSSTENYASYLQDVYKGQYLSTNTIGAINDKLSGFNNFLSAYDAVQDPLADAAARRDLLECIADLERAKFELSKMDLSDLTALANKCSEVAGLSEKADKLEDSFSAVDFSRFEGLSKLSLKAPKWLTKAGNVAGKVGDGLTYVTAAVDTFTAVVSTINGYAALTSATQSYGAMHQLFTQMQYSEISFVSIAASELKLSVESQFIKMMSEVKMVYNDFMYSWDEVGIGMVLAECGPIGWAIAIGRTVGDLLTGISKTSKEHIYMISVGEASKSSAYLLRSSIVERGNFFHLAGENTMDYMLLCGAMRINGEQKVIDSSAAQSWLYKKINNHEGVVELCTDTIEKMKDLLVRYGLYSRGKPF